MQEDMNRRPRPAPADPVGSVQQAREDAATERAIGATVLDAEEEVEPAQRGEAADRHRPAEGRDTTSIEQAAAGAGRLDMA